MTENAYAIMATIRYNVRKLVAYLLQDALPASRQDEMSNDAWMHVASFLNHDEQLQVLAPRPHWQQDAAIALAGLENLQVLVHAVENPPGNPDNAIDNDEDGFEEGDDGLLAVWDAPVAAAAPMQIEEANAVVQNNNNDENEVQIIPVIDID